MEKSKRKTFILKGTCADCGTKKPISELGEVREQVGIQINRSLVCLNNCSSPGSHRE